MQKYAIIVAGGSGTRMGTTIPKQFIELNKKPVLMHTISRFFDFDQSIKIIVILPADQIAFWKELCGKHNFNLPHKIIEGGSERFYSVKKGLDEITGEGLVAIHDGVRPLVSINTIYAAFESAEKFGNGIPCIDLNDSIRKIDQNASSAQNRKDYKLVQTPQCFQISVIKKAFEQPFNNSFTDDASVIEAARHKVYITEGNRENIKITTPFDIKLAEAYLSQMN